MKFTRMPHHFFYMFNPLEDDHESFIIVRHSAQDPFYLMSLIYKQWNPKTILKEEEELHTISLFLVPLRFTHSNLMNWVVSKHPSQKAHNPNALGLDGGYMESLCVPTIIRSAHG